MNDETTGHTGREIDHRLDGWCIKKPTWHFHRQLFARYGVVLEFGEFSEMLRDIRSGRAELIERQSGQRAIYAVLLTRHWKRIFVATKGEHVVTALPPKLGLRKKWNKFYRR